MLPFSRIGRTGIGSLLGGIVGRLNFRVKSVTGTVTVTSPAPTVGNISMGINPTNVVLGQTPGNSSQITGVVTDTSGAPMVGLPVYLFMASGPGPFTQQGASVNTGAGGAYGFTVVFSSPGTYTFDVADNASNT